MNEPTDEELTAIYNEANAGKSVAWSMANGCFAAMRLAMEKARKEAAAQLVEDLGHQDLATAIRSRNETEVPWESNFSLGELQDQ